MIKNRMVQLGVGVGFTLIAVYMYGFLHHYKIFNKDGEYYKINDKGIEAWIHTRSATPVR